jgi:demethylmenaquinone methyltransferase/2-methoxy-6-polyprenyl-1,4-benzoquinol methylase
MDAHSFPHIVDCQPIDAAADLESAGFKVRDDVEIKIWSMPVAAVVGIC